MNIEKNAFNPKCSIFLLYAKMRIITAMCFRQKLKYQQNKNDVSMPKPTNSKELLTVKFRYKEPNEGKSKKTARVVCLLS